MRKVRSGGLVRLSIAWHQFRSLPYELTDRVFEYTPIRGAA